MEIAYHASHEQFSPSQLLKYCKMAGESGFHAVHSSDHFHPWSARNGQSGNSFAWIGVAMQQSNLPFSIVCCPGQRYHPAIIAQMAATLAEMFPGRIGLELGSGEAINESITGNEWSGKAFRNHRLYECYKVISALVRGERVNFAGTVTVKEAQLYTLPSILPPVIVAALSMESIKWCATWAEGLLTTGDLTESTFARIQAFRESSGRPRPVYIQFAFSYARTAQYALASAYEQWRGCLAAGEYMGDWEKPEDFDQAGDLLSLREVEERIPVFSSVKELEVAIGFFKRLPISRLILHNVSVHQTEFIEDMKQLLR